MFTTATMVKVQNIRLYRAHLKVRICTNENYAQKLIT